MDQAALEPPPLSREFRTQRIINWMSLGFLYAFFYMTRYNYTAVAPTLADLLGWKNTELGVFETMMPLVYGLSVVLNGPFADRIGGKKAFLFGAIGVACMNFLFGLASLGVTSPAVWEGAGMARHVVTPAVLKFGLSGGMILTMMAIVWGLNGYFQTGAGRHELFLDPHGNLHREFDLRDLGYQSFFQSEP